MQKELFENQQRYIYTRITALDWNERPLQTIQGYVREGGVNGDGDSAVRRTCNLDLITEQADINAYFWGLNTKFKLESGIKNSLNDKITWLNLGIYIITSFSCSLNANNYSINIQGKDKMCLLNGEISGAMAAETRFDSYDYVYDDGSIETIKYPIKTIIKDAIHQFANEPLHNIIINDLDNRALELLEYNYDTPMYLLRLAGSSIYDQGSIGGDEQVYVNGITPLKLSQLGQYDSLVEELDMTNESPVFTMELNGATEYQAAEIKYGDTAGYRTIELTYPSDLTLRAGEPLTAMLDKLVNMLGSFEYFYDINGIFIFQEKTNYSQSTWSNVIAQEDGTYVDSLAESYIYKLEDNKLITNINNTPNIQNIKNDFTIWGTNQNNNPIHLRYAIKNKPSIYVGFDFDGDNWLERQVYNTDIYDWRELIYQMQADYRKYNHYDDYGIQLHRFNPWCQNGLTGYEPYYIDIEGFWRQLYYPVEDRIAAIEKIDEAVASLGEASTAAAKNRRAQLLQQKEDLLVTFGLIEINNGYRLEGGDYETDGWHKNVRQDPSQLSYWIEFLDNGDLQLMSNEVIGNRIKVVNDDGVKSLFNKQTPEIIFTTGNEQAEELTAYRYFNVSQNDYDNMFKTSTQGKSAKDTLDNLLYNHSYAIETISLTLLPIYDLELNSRIYLSDKKYKINGEYIINKYTIPLTYNGTMSVTAIKAMQDVEIWAAFGADQPSQNEYRIINILHNVISSNSNLKVEKNSKFETILTPKLGYKISQVSITMGNQDVTNQVYDEISNKIIIEEVTNDITIIAFAYDNSVEAILSDGVLYIIKAPAIQNNNILEVT